MSRSVLITGGAGFVGSHLCGALVGAGASVVAVDNLQNGLRDNLAEGVEFVLADISGETFLSHFAHRRFDAVIHCAAQSSNALSFRDPMLDIASNQIGTLNVLRLCERLRIPRLLFTSSMSVYGQAECLPTPETEPVRPQSLYAVHKAASEQYIQLLAPASGIHATIFRLFTTYGPGQNLANRDQGLVSIYLSYVLRGEPVVVKGSGERRRDLIYIEDVVRALLGALDERVTFGKTYNLGSGRAHRIADVVRWLVRACGGGLDYPVVYEAPTPGDPRETLADVSRLHEDLGWEPRIAVDEGITHTVRAYRNAAKQSQHEGV